MTTAGVISGTPTSTTAANFTITATDAQGCTGAQAFTITTGCPTITIDQLTLPNGTVGAAYNQTLTASGGNGAITWSVTGTLPAGLSLNTTTGALTGTPTSTASQTFSITATDANNCTGSRSFTVQPACNTLTINPATLPNGTVGVAYAQTLTQTGGTADRESNTSFDILSDTEEMSRGRLQPLAWPQESQMPIRRGQHRALATHRDGKLLGRFVWLVGQKDRSRCLPNIPSEIPPNEVIN